MRGARHGHRRCPGPARHAPGLAGVRGPRTGAGRGRQGGRRARRPSSWAWPCAARPPPRGCGVRSTTCSSPPGWPREAGRFQMARELLAELATADEPRSPTAWRRCRRGSRPCTTCCATRPRAEMLDEPLTGRELDVLRLLQGGLSLQRDRRRALPLLQHGQDPRPGGLSQAGRPLAGRGRADRAAAVADLTPLASGRRSHPGEIGPGDPHSPIGVRRWSLSVHRARGSPPMTLVSASRRGLTDAVSTARDSPSPTEATEAESEAPTWGWAVVEIRQRRDLGTSSGRPGRRTGRRGGARRGDRCSAWPIGSGSCHRSCRLTSARSTCRTGASTRLPPR